MVLRQKLKVWDGDDECCDLLLVEPGLEVYLMRWQCFSILARILCFPTLKRGNCFSLSD